MPCPGTRAWVMGLSCEPEKTARDSWVCGEHAHTCTCPASLPSSVNPCVVLMAHQEAAEAAYRARYATLKRVYESRLASLAETVRGLAQRIEQDELAAALQDDPATRPFASQHAHDLLVEGLSSEREAFVETLAHNLAAAEHVAAQRREQLACAMQRNGELEGELAAVQESAADAAEAAAEAAATADRHLRASASSSDGAGDAAALAQQVQQLRNEYVAALEAAAQTASRLRAENADLHAEVEGLQTDIVSLRRSLRDAADAEARARDAVAAGEDEARAAAADTAAAAAKHKQQSAEAAAAAVAAIAELTASLDAAKVATAQALSDAAAAESAALAAREDAAAAVAAATEQADVQVAEVTAMLRGTAASEARDAGTALQSLKERAKGVRRAAAAELQLARDAVAQAQAARDVAEARAAALESAAAAAQQAMHDMAQREQQRAEVLRSTQAVQTEAAVDGGNDTSAAMQSHNSNISGSSNGRYNGDKGAPSAAASPAKRWRGGSKQIDGQGEEAVNVEQWAQHLLEAAANVAHLKRLLQEQAERHAAAMSAVTAECER